MTFSDDQVRQYLKKSGEEAKLHTDVLLSIPKAGGKPALSSCLHLRHKERHLIVTCKHVLLGDDRAYFTGAKRTLSEMIEENQSDTKTLSLQLLGQNAKLDLAVFEGSGVDLEGTGKITYSLDDSSWFSKESLEVGTAAYIYGIWGDRSDIYQYPDKLVSLNARIYAAMGPIDSVQENSVVADMAEVKIVLAGKNFQEEKPTGGPRDLSGISGSGLWVRMDDSVRLVGVVLGSKGNDPTKHLIRTTPVWALEAWLDEVLQEE